MRMRHGSSFRIDHKGRREIDDCWASWQSVEIYRKIRSSTVIFDIREHFHLLFNVELRKQNSWGRNGAGKGVFTVQMVHLSISIAEMYFSNSWRFCESWNIHYLVLLHDLLTFHPLAIHEGPLYLFRKQFNNNNNFIDLYCANINPENFHLRITLLNKILKS